MSTSPTKLSVQFREHLNYTEMTRKKMEALLLNGTIVRRDIEQVYKGLYLDAITNFENLIEALFIGLLVDRFSTSSIIKRASFKSDRVARDIIYGGRNYTDWFPYDLTEKRANAFFRAGSPFTCLDKFEKNKIKIFLYIRNAILIIVLTQLKCLKMK